MRRASKSPIIELSVSPNAAFFRSSGCGTYVVVAAVRSCAHGRSTKVRGEGFVVLVVCAAKTIMKMQKKIDIKMEKINIKIAKKFAMRDAFGDS